MKTDADSPAGRAAVLGRIRRAATLVELRARVARVASWSPFVLSPGVAAAAVALAVHKIWPQSLNALQTVIVFAAVGAAVLAVLLYAFLVPLGANAGTIALDKHHRLDGRLTNAIEFSRIPKGERTPLMDAAIDEACAFVSTRPSKSTLAASAAAPIAFPVAALFAFFPAALLVVIAMLEVPRPIPSEPPKPTIDALALTEDDLDLLRDAAKEMERPDQSPEVRAALDRFNRLIEDLAQKRLDRTEAFRQMEAIEREFLAGTEADKKKMEQELRETARQLEKSDLMKEVAEALKKNDLKEAEKKMKEAAQKLREMKKPDKAQIERLREALKKASQQRKEALAAINEKRAELQEQLLAKKKEIEQEKDPQKKKEEESLLKKKERELERLDREAEQQQRANRELERLDRELAEAFQDLMKEAGITPEDLKRAAEDLQQAAEDMNRMEREGMTQKEKEDLKQRLKELREMIRQQGQGGQKRMSRMLKFSKRARGKGGQSGDDGEGEEGEGKQGQGKQGQGEGEEGEGEGEGGKGKGKGKGQGQGDGEGLELTLGPGGVPIGPGGSAVERESPSGGDGDKPGPGGGKGGKEWGNQAGGNPRGDATNPDMDTIDVDAQGIETGQGPTNGKVILSAAEKGFRGSAYKKVFTDYKTVAEESINKEQIPDGYRFYVQRYFQLIRPRD